MFRIAALAPASLAATPLAEEARRENFLFLDRLLKAAKTGEPLFTAESEIFLGAYVDNKLAGVGGISWDPLEPLLQQGVCATYKSGANGGADI